MDKAAFRVHLDSQIYDKYYQDIEYINFIGYSESFKTWEKIKDLIAWKNITVVDIGCFHGYFSFKAEQLGANVLGLDINLLVLNTTSILANLYNSTVKLLEWEAGETLKQTFDVALFLNVLHHFKDPDKVISKDIQCKQAIFEINKNQIEMIKKYYIIQKEVKSHRTGRIILLGVRNE